MKEPNNFPHGKLRLRHPRCFGHATEIVFFVFFFLSSRSISSHLKLRNETFACELFRSLPISVAFCILRAFPSGKNCGKNFSSKKNALKQMLANNRRLLAGFACDSRSEIQAVPCFSDGGVKIQKCIIVGPLF